VRPLALWVSVLLTAAAGIVACLVVLPPPTTLAFYMRVYFAEKTLIIVGGVVGAALLARLSGARRWIVWQAALAIVIVAVALLPPLASLRVAVAGHVAIDFARYLRAPVDDGPARGVESVVYATVDGQPLSVDVYRPSVPPGRQGPLPAIVVFHEGGWSRGDKGSASRMSAWLAARGWAVFDAQYRLAPQPNWKTSIGDVKCAIGWVKRHARDVGVDVDPDRVTLLGRSAGGHLSLLAAYAPDDPALPASCDAGDTRVASVISYYGPTDLAWGWAHTRAPRVFDMRQRVTNYLGATPAEAPDRYLLMSPLARAGRRSTPTLLIHGAADDVVPIENTYFMDARLTALGVRHAVLVVPRSEHGFDMIFGGLGEQLAEAAVLRFLRGEG
jgi:acetyl esterase/lipase